MTPEEFREVERRQHGVIAAAQSAIEAAREAAEACPVPERLRPATERDIVVGAILWYPRWAEDGYAPWSVVEEVLRPGDAFKAYAYQGARYGLDGAFVEVKDG